MFDPGYHHPKAKPIDPPHRAAHPDFHVLTDTWALPSMHRKHAMLQVGLWISTVRHHFQDWVDLRTTMTKL